MKTKGTIALILVLIASFITIQSFRSYSPKITVIKRQMFFKGYPVHAALCAPLFDTATTIPALKGWGNYKWKISHASDSVQFYFNQGINLYYGFHLIEAVASFDKATRIDPSCAMAWYGKALALGPTINHPNAYRGPAEAYTAAKKSMDLSAQCAAVEKDLIEAIQHRYSTDTTIAVMKLRKSYADAMETVYQKHPANADVITLYADALLLLHPWDLYAHDFAPKPWTPKICSLLEKAIAISPYNPGANHYHIHAVEASATPGRALGSAHLLDTLMPGVAHVTHMPSHIYIRTGDYQRGIKNNERALAGYNNYLKLFPSVQDNVPLYSLHNMHMRINCAQMAGNYQIAMDGSKELQASIPGFFMGTRDAMANYVQYVFMETFLTNLRFGKWDAIIGAPATDTLVYGSILQHFAKGIAYSRKGDLSSAQKELGLLDKQLQDKSLDAGLDNFSPFREPGSVAKLILHGVIAEAQKKYPEAIDYLQQAVSTEDHIIYDEPRDWAIPARQYLANVLLEAKKYDQAIAVLKRDLVINPKNGWSLTGLKIAYSQTGNSRELATVNTQLRDAFKIADTKIDKVVF